MTYEAKVLLTIGLPCGLLRGSCSSVSLGGSWSCSCQRNLKDTTAAREREKMSVSVQNLFPEDSLGSGCE